MNNVTELWKDIKGYEGLYQISNLGRVKSLSRITSQNKILPEIILKPQLCGHGYFAVGLCKNGKMTNNYIHRLVADMFILNPSDLQQVNHIDGDKSNNCVENLEWISNSDNNLHAVKNKLKFARKVIVEKDGNIIEFNSEQECSKYFGFNRCWIKNNRVRKGNNFKYKNYKITIKEYD